MDEVFGEENFISARFFSAKTSDRVFGQILV